MDQMNTETCIKEKVTQWVDITEQAIFAEIRDQPRYKFPRVLGPVSRESVDELKEIISLIKNGTYKHEQYHWHCGTSHCIAGFKEMRDMAKLVHRFDPEIDANKYVECVPYERIEDLATTAKLKLAGPAYGAYSTYGRLAWGLTKPEGEILFSANNTLDEIQYMVQKFDDGYRSVNLADTLSDTTWFNPITERKEMLRYMRSRGIKVRDLF
jgi:hypothetical protein